MFILLLSIVALTRSLSLMVLCLGQLVVWSWRRERPLLGSVRLTLPKLVFAAVG